MDRMYELLAAVNQRAIRTAADIAEALQIHEAEAVRGLAAAHAKGFVEEDTDLSASLPEDQRRVWFLTEAGRAELDQVDTEDE